MVMVRALQKCFTNNMLRQVGDEFEHDGKISPDVMVALEDLEPTRLPRKTRVKAPVTPADPEVHHGLPNDVT